MFFRLFKSKLGFTFVELMIAVMVLGILTAFAVPLLVSAYKVQARKDCQNQCTVIQAQVEEAMYGMLDNGTMQYKRNGEGKVIVPKTVAISFTNVQSDHKTVYVADGITGNSDDAYNGKECFVLCESQAIPGQIAFTLGDLRGGYRPSNIVDYEDGWVAGYHLKKKKLENVEFYKYLPNQEIPVCPFSDPDEEIYYYYIFDDGSVICSCPECHGE